VNGAIERAVNALRQAARPGDMETFVTPAVVEIEGLRAELAALQGKALRFDLDRLGIERREQDAVELVELRAAHAMLSKEKQDEFDIASGYYRRWQQTESDRAAECAVSAALQADNARMRAALEGLYRHTKNNVQICGLNEAARAALSAPAPAGTFVTLPMLKQIDLAIHYAPPSPGVCDYIRAAIRDAEKEKT
jgi:hypothetical protein